MAYRSQLLSSILFLAYFIESRRSETIAHRPVNLVHISARTIAVSLRSATIMRRMHTRARTAMVILIADNRAWNYSRRQRVTREMRNWCLKTTMWRVYDDVNQRGVRYSCGLNMTRPGIIWRAMARKLGTIWGFVVRDRLL